MSEAEAERCHKCEQGMWDKGEAGKIELFLFYEHLSGASIEWSVLVGYVSYFYSDMSDLYADFV
jgi:hypothetical protein